ncbi:PhnD/SsuA/transferrin family substrate-binding protein [candidate division FCPU426 bacterium]|nr:PhnD/SsuA/transferrin family substrate-binding protein [candidate division FCPU426 bacterium]
MEGKGRSWQACRLTAPVYNSCRAFWALIKASADVNVFTGMVVMKNISVLQAIKLLFLLSGVFLVLAGKGEARELAKLLYAGGEPGTQPDIWLDQDQGIKPTASVFYAQNREQLTLVLENDSGWGTIRSQNLQLDLAAADFLEIRFSQMEADGKLVVDLVLEKPLQGVFRCERLFLAGEYRYNLKQVLKVDGPVEFSVQLTIEGRQGSKMSLEKLVIIAADNDNVFGGDYHEKFMDFTGRTPRYWRSGHNNATLSVKKGGGGTLALGAEKKYGDVISPVFENTGPQKYGEVRLQIGQISTGAYLDVVLQEEESAYRDLMLFKRITRPGLYAKKIDSLLYQHSLARFSIKIWINGAPGQSQAVIRAFDLNRINRPPADSTSPYLQIGFIGIKGGEKTYWQERFNVKNGEQPQNWWDGTNNLDFNAEIINALGDDHAEVSMAKRNTWGKVLSPNLQCDFAKYPELVVHITGLSPGTKWRLGLQEMNSANWRHWFLQDEAVSKTGIFTYDCSRLTQLGADDIFRLEIILENPKYIEGLKTKTVPAENDPSGVKPPEPRPNVIAIGIENRMYEDFGSIQEAQALTRHLQAVIQKGSALPIKVYNYSAEDLRLAYQRGGVDILLSYREAYQQYHRRGQLAPFLTIARKGEKKQSCGLYVRAESGFDKSADLRGRRLAYSENQVRTNLQDIFPALAAPAFFSEMTHEKNVRNLIFALQMQRTDAVAEFEFIEQIAQEMGVSLRCLERSTPRPNAFAYARTSKNPEKNKEIQKIQKIILDATADPENGDFIKFYGIDAFVRPSQ